MPDRPTSQLCAITAIAGALTLLGGTLLHPAGADPNNPLAAFAEYAADHNWVASHLLQLLGMTLIVAALVFLTRLLAQGAGASWAEVGAVGAGASLAVAAVLQAVDGIALKVMVDRWAAATAAAGADKELLFMGAFAVRQVEIGLASILSLMMGITVLIYGVAFLYDQRFAKWLGWLAMLGGVALAAAGIASAYTGFSDVAMTTNMASSLLLLVWLIVVGGVVWRLAAAKSSEPPKR